jgi:hypothetical protein
LTRVYLLTLSLLVGCAVKKPCTRIAPLAGANLAALYRERRVPLLLVEDSVLVCDCALERQTRGDTQARQLGGDTQARQLGGDTQARQLGGDTQARQLGGDTQARQLGGDTQARQLGGDTQARQLGGDTQARQLGGNTQARQLGGDTQARQVGGATEARELGGAGEDLMCKADDYCRGYRYLGHGRVQVFDGTRTFEAADRCVAY